MAALKSVAPGITALREIQVSTHKDKARLVEMNKLATEALAEKHKAPVASSRRWLCVTAKVVQGDGSRRMLAA